MKVDKFLKEWYNKEIEDWGGVTSPEYEKFQSNYRSVLKEICSSIGFELHSFHKNHYEFTAVVQSNKTERFYYVSISDVRYWKNEWADRVLFRTMEHDKDWTGGPNCYCRLTELADCLDTLDRRSW